MAGSRKVCQSVSSRSHTDAKAADLLSVGLNQSNDDFLAVQNELAQIWAGLVPSFNKDNIHVVLSIEHAISKAKSIADQNTAQVLVTGSMHLVGGAIEVASLAHSVFGGH
jgi:folylpolyglutamate synthase